MAAVRDIELSAVSETARRFPPASGDDLEYVLLRWHGRPVGRLVLDGNEGAHAAELWRAALEAAAPAIGAVSGEGHASLLSPSAVSVVVATRDRPSELATSLEALRGLGPEPGEIWVVDSGSEREREIAELAARYGARRLRLDRPGLSLARNAGAEAATGAILAFLDDDCRVDPGWLTALRDAFSDPTVDAVTGLLLPAELETPAQRLFLRYSHMDRRGFSRRRFTRDRRESRYWPIDVWRAGSGGNLAVRKEALSRLGGFHTGLGLGTAARSGEDLFLLWSLLEQGGAIEYRPDAMAWHRHHRTLEALRGVLYGYGRGHSAYLRAAIQAGAGRGAARRYRLSFFFDRAKRFARSLTGHAGYPPSLVVCELAGSFAGMRAANGRPDGSARARNAA